MPYMDAYSLGNTFLLPNTLECRRIGMLGNKKRLPNQRFTWK